MSLAERIKTIREQIAQAQARSPRASTHVDILAVSKSQSLAQIREAMAEKIFYFGENYVQEWLKKAEGLRSQPIAWDFIGHLQSNKVKFVVGRVRKIHSVDRLSVAQEIHRCAAKMGLRQNILIEINIGEEPNKSGIVPQEAPELIKNIARLEHLNLEGLMVMPPLFSEPEDSRSYFARAKSWLKQWQPLVGSEHQWRELSMGTSVDYVVAVEEGATMVRLGTALFGSRD